MAMRYINLLFISLLTCLIYKDSVELGLLCTCGKCIKMLVGGGSVLCVRGEACPICLIWGVASDACLKKTEQKLGWHL